ncbi:excalibur calcium-binding domain-containing protein [Vibrio sp. Y2-5]|uniref:excalibur calcium-binding domain-containing protein n=1 Tax=Vibrio sp. Y2-5 TaxID=2743977 RepID=UPI001660F0F9|nr:excalibur calcium-binding domain-containing protein [Vibrio sp. Y2-5]MBD0788200.1 excalibur calcium-binding domain-containing protein [Vibrio sp. Y2-5]
MDYIVRALIFASLAFSNMVTASEIWHGLVVEPENRCSAYNKKEQYPYPASIEHDIVKQMGGVVYGPYTGHYFSSISSTDIEHIVATNEGHDSGLCHASAEVREQFATDLLNLTLAAPIVNRCSKTGKCGLDPGEWLPPKNQCWFANRVIEIKLKYHLSVDRLEADTLQSVLNGCDSFDMIFYPKQEEPQTTTALHEEQNGGTNSAEDTLTKYDDNRNGRITCSEAKKHGITPVRKDHPAYQFMMDKDGDGVVCEN